MSLKGNQKFAQLPQLLQTEETLYSVAKPAGMATLNQANSTLPSVADWLIQQDPQQTKVSTPNEAGIVHRLDNETSGLILAARTPFTYQELRNKWNTPEVHKKYLALCLGVIPGPVTINTSIAHHPSKKNKMVVCETAAQEKKLKAKPALTQVTPIRVIQNATLIEVEIMTGVRHQIRVHLASLGHPLVGDPLYQNPKKQQFDAVKLNRHFLHLLEITLNLGEEAKIFRCELSDDLKLCLDELES